MTTLLDVTLTLEWDSATANGPVRHRDSLFAAGTDPDRDTLPSGVMDNLAAADMGETVERMVSATELGGEAPGAIVELPLDALRSPHALGAAGRLRAGVFYPSTLFALPPEHRRPYTFPVRCLGTAGGAMTLDTRHPLADFAPRLAATVLRNFDGDSTRRPPVDWGRRLASGPGMQACWRGRETDFVYDGAYARPDEAADGTFYAAPRIVAHIDRRAQAVVGDFYSRVLPPDGMVLDLMSSAHSNLSPGQRYGALVGLGMNAAELNANPRLTHAVIADLNAGADLPFADASLDAAICTVSIDYLSEPARIVAAVGRALRPGAAFAVAFSNRWFPPKVTRLWTELTSFEQMALVVRYFRQSGLFDGMETASFRGLPRPPDDDYAAYTDESDPVFAVVGRRVSP